MRLRSGVEKSIAGRPTHKSTGLSKHLHLRWRSRPRHLCSDSRSSRACVARSGMLFGSVIADLLQERSSTLRAHGCPRDLTRPLLSSSGGLESLSGPDESTTKHGGNARTKSSPADHALLMSSDVRRSVSALRSRLGREFGRDRDRTWRATRSNETRLHRLRRGSTIHPRFRIKQVFTVFICVRLYSSCAFIHRRRLERAPVRNDTDAANPTTDESTSSALASLPTHSARAARTDQASGRGGYRS